MVEFPGLGGLKIPVRDVAFEVFGLGIYWYGIIIAFGFVLAVLLATRESERFGFNSDQIIDVVLIAAPISIVCARLYYVAFSWENYKDNLAEIFNLRHGGLAIYGAVLGGLATAYVYSRKKKISPLSLFDFCVPYLVLAQGIGRWGNFVNQEAFGANTMLPWGMTSEKIQMDLSAMQMQGMKVDPNLPVHPTFLYESIWNLLVFAVLIAFRKKKKLEGEVFFLYMILYGLGRFFIEGLRTDSLMLGSVRVSQALAFVFAAAFTFLFFLRRRKTKPSEQENVELGTSDAYGALVMQMKSEREENAENNTSAGDTAPKLNENSGSRDKDAASGGNPVGSPEETDAGDKQS